MHFTPFKALKPHSHPGNGKYADVKYKKAQKETHGHIRV
jgi:hypothetical protein